MTDAELDKLEALADGATPGPWRFRERGSIDHKGCARTCGKVTHGEQIDYETWVFEPVIMDDEEYYPSAPVPDRKSVV